MLDYVIDFQTDQKAFMAAPASLFLLFGATGDLARRMLYPSLFHLHREGRLADDMAIVGTARSAMTLEAFRASIAEALVAYLPADQRDAAAEAAFIARLDYRAVDIAQSPNLEPLQDLAPAPGGAAVHFLSTAPDYFGPIVTGLAAAGLAGPNARVIIEKPIGRDLASSQAVNDAVGAAFTESQIFRIDHYLGKETVQNLMALRFGNSLFEPLWNATGIEQVQITVAETVGLETRAGYYDGYGAIRDMVQNHLLQLLALVAMEPPAQLDAAAVRNEKIKVLRSLRPIDRQDIHKLTATGQYSAGAVGGQAVKGYLDELGKASATETFVALRADIDNWRWKGVPFYLRTGKRLPHRASEIVIQFRPVPHSIFGNVLSSNKLIIRLQPEEDIRLTVMAKEPGLASDGVRLRELPLNLSLSAAFAGTRRRIAYERLILDALEGNPTLFVRRDEIEAAWTWIDQIVAHWKATGMTPRPYPAGSWGPSEAVILPSAFGHRWHE
jgi:glucose-6-phosphate 1-dehydrogenase